MGEHSEFDLTLDKLLSESNCEKWGGCFDNFPECLIIDEHSLDEEGEDNGYFWVEEVYRIMSVDSCHNVFHDY